MNLSPREAQVLAIIAKRIQKDGRPPTQDIIAGHLKYEARSYVYRLLKRLEAKGKIRRDPYKVRGIELVEGSSAA